ncbi:gliding motility-associated C-terminal domain-containing protein [Flavobacterium wongokense]|uniref:T9SS type B sorting domain-containing protein n=1 Tax=Flavobacterium wongokense TaxID=2910674 RepID=UPI001F46E2FF|nr:gliding motility-associated C-terminal domain-containing protein [Flavobacterium sp. WG47]MCF6130697.1 gliding motility-associated C-terminal domain-containing protein [Flavobacterium sp. WG47]
MRLERYSLLFILLFCFIFKTNGQNVSLYNQFNGRFDFTFIGNTLNEFPNGTGAPCVTLPSSDATLNLGPNDVIERAYLYWAGSGTGDFDVKLNGVDITSERSFSAIQTITFPEFFTRPFFSAFADVTAQLQATGNGLYTLTELDVNPFFDDTHYCNNATNFAGWAIVIVYKNPSLPLNQLNVYDGLEALSSPNPDVVVDHLTINLGNLNVLDNSGAKLGFIAWEGDANIFSQESLLINNHALSDALNPVGNPFNGTNNITGNSQLNNMDLDIYPIQNFITIGNTSATIDMTTARDYVLINAIVTKLNSQLPDATVVVDSVEQECDSRTITLNYTVSNLNATNPLPAGTPIAIYVDGVFTAFDETTLPIDIDDSMSFHLTMVIPDTVPLDFEITVVVDDTGNGTGIVAELNETNNNSAIIPVSLWVSPTFNTLEPLVSCNESFTRGTFDFTSYENLVKTNPEDHVSFHETYDDAAIGANAISDPNNYIAATTPKEIFVRIYNDNCFSITSFLLTTRNCPPTVYNYISANNDSYNETFFIAGLRNIFMDFKLEVYNRWGRLVWTGNNNTEDWDGHIKDGFSGKNATDGTYFYLLFLNDVDYPEPLKGFLYINH